MIMIADLLVGMSCGNLLIVCILTVHKKFSDNDIFSVSISYGLVFSLLMYFVFSC